MNKHSVLGLAGIIALSAACSGQDAVDNTEDGNWLDKNCEQTTVGEPALRRLTKRELQNTIEDLFPELEGRWSQVQLGPDPRSEDGFSNSSDMLVMNEQTAKDWLSTAEEVADALTAPEVLGQILPCSTSSADEACASTLVSTYGRRLFRRSLSDAEQQPYLSLFGQVRAKSDFQTATKWMIVSLLQSPHVAYRSEMGVTDGSRHVLTRHELATALAYTYTGSTPSESLIERAERGEFDTAEARVEAARALLDTPRGRQNVHHYVDEWLDYSHVEVASDAVRDGQMGPRMVQETEAFVEHVLYDQNGDIGDLLTSRSTMLDRSLSAFYGFGDVQSEQLVSVERPAHWGVGLLAQGSVLASHSHPDSSSPTLRGMLIYERLLCQTMPPPPADIPPIEPPKPGIMTTRERYEEQHMQSEACASCHQFTDPAGFAFENFDAFGRYRADESGLPIDSSGAIPFLEGDKPVADQRQLAQELADSEQVQVCVSSLVANYAFGAAHGGLNKGMCAIHEPQARLLAGEVGLLEYWAQLAGTLHFSERRSDK